MIYFLWYIYGILYFMSELANQNKVFGHVHELWNPVKAPQTEFIIKKPDSKRHKQTTVYYHIS